MEVFIAECIMKCSTRYTIFLRKVEEKQEIKTKVVAKKQSRGFHLIDALTLAHTLMD